MDDDRGGIEITQGEFSEAFYAMVGRALSDTAYREELLAGGDRRREAARRAGLVWNDDLDSKLEEAIKALDNLADHFGELSSRNLTFERTYTSADRWRTGCEEIRPMADGSDNDFYAILGRALVDPRFRERLRDDNDRVAALSEVGIELNDEQLQQLDENLDSVDNLAQQFGANRSAAT